MSPANKAAATRRIRRRAAQWREVRTGYSVETLVAQLRGLDLDPRTVALRVEQSLSDHRGGLHRALREMREGEGKRSPHMRPYWRQQAVKWLAACRAAPLAREALAIVTGERGA